MNIESPDAGISADKGGDICAQKRRYLRTKTEISVCKAM